MVGGGTHAFATMLASFLAGHRDRLGGRVAARHDPRAAPRSASAWRSSGSPPSRSRPSPSWTGFPNFADWLGARRDSCGADVAACMATLFPAALCIGATFPFAVRVLARERDDAGPASARVYAWNTVGSIAGSVCAGFFLVPGLGFEGTLALAVAINLALALALARCCSRRGVRCSPPLRSPAPSRSRCSRPPRRGRCCARPRWAGSARWGEVTYLGVGRSSTVLVTEQRFVVGAAQQRPARGRHAASGRGPAPAPASSRWLSALPVLARPEARSLLLVGLGGGMAIEVVPESIERIDVIELEPEVVAANQLVASGRWRDPLSDPRVHVHLNDARNALLLASARFDAIVSQPSHPWAGGAAHLYTHEFFQLVSRRLAPGGVFVQWIGLPFVDEELFRSLLATLADVFPHVQAYVPPPAGSVLFLASNAPIDMEDSIPRALAATPGAVRVDRDRCNGGRAELPAARRGWGPRARARRRAQSRRPQPAAEPLGASAQRGDRSRGGSTT